MGGGIDSLPLVRIRDFSYTWPEAAQPALESLNLELHLGQICICAGGNGSGKSSLALAIAGIIPHKTGGKIRGSIEILGVDTRQSNPLEISKNIGISFQQPQGQFFTLSLEEEVAFSLEQRAMDPHDIRCRVRDVLEFTGLKGMENRSPQELSGGEMQRASLAILLAFRPRVYLLDEPFAALDPGGRRAMMALLNRLAREHQAAVVIFSKDPLPLLSHADQFILLDQGRIVTEQGMKEDREYLALEGSQVHWSQVYTLGGYLREKGLLSRDLLTLDQAISCLAPLSLQEGTMEYPSKEVPSSAGNPTLLSLKNLCFSYDLKRSLLTNLSLNLNPGDLLWLVGENGSGKTTLFKLIMGLLKPREGAMELQNRDVTSHGLESRAGTLGYALQNPDLQLFAQSVEDELAFGPENLGWPKERIRKSLEQWTSFFKLHDIARESPMMQTFSVRKWIALASVVVMDPLVYLLDEPDWTLDRRGRSILAEFIKMERARGKAFVIISHNQENMAQLGGDFLLLQKEKAWLTGPMEELFYDDGPWRHTLDLAQLPQAQKYKWLTPESLAEMIQGVTRHG